MLMESQPIDLPKPAFRIGRDIELIRKRLNINNKFTCVNIFLFLHYFKERGLLIEWLYMNYNVVCQLPNYLLV